MNGIHGGFHGILYNRILPPVFKHGNRLEIPEVLMDKSSTLGLSNAIDYRRV